MKLFLHLELFEINKIQKSFNNNSCHTYFRMDVRMKHGWKRGESDTAHK